MPIKPESSPALDVLYHVAATAWLNQWGCRVRRCRRDGRCQDRARRFGMPLCVRDMPDAEIDEMLDFVCNTIELATPERRCAKSGAGQDGRRARNDRIPAPGVSPLL